MLGINSDDIFDELCKKIRAFRRPRPHFIFEYDGGIKKNLIYDFLNNTLEYDDYGNEYYSSLIFYEVDDFSIQEYERIDQGLKEKFYLTRDNVPVKIFRVGANKELDEIEF